MTTCKNPTDKAMQHVDWFRRAAATSCPAASVITVTVDGTPFAMRRGDTVATAVLLAGKAVYRTTVVEETPRNPFCMMGVCFDCLVEVDGVPNCQGCLLTVRDGMRIVRQLGLTTRNPAAG